MVTKEIKAGSQPTNGGTPVVSQKAGDEELAKKFAAVLQGLLGGQSLQALVGSEELPEVQAAAPQAVKEKEPEPEPVAKPEVADDKDEVSAGADKDDTNKQVAKDDTQPATEEVAQACATVVQAEKPKAEETERVTEVAVTEVKEEAPVEVQQAAAPVTEQQTQTAEQVTAQHTEKQVQAPVTQVTKTAETEVKVDKAQAATEAVQPVEAQQAQTQEAAETAAPEEKAVSAKPAGKQKGESYYAIQRALEVGTEDEPAVIEPEAVKQDAKMPVDGTKSAKQDALEMVQALMLREAAGGDRQTIAGLARGTGQGHQSELSGVTGQTAAGDRFIGGRVKAGTLSAEMNQQRIIDQVKDLLKKAAANREGNVLTVRLNPPELGEMTVKVTHRENQVFARIIPESKEVETMLKERAGDVQQVLIHAGLKPDQVHVAIGTERSDSEMFGFNQFLNGGQNGAQEDSGSSKDSESGEGTGGESADWSGVRYAAEDVSLESGWVA